MTHLFLKACTNSEWDNVSFAVVELSDIFIQTLRDLSNKAAFIKKEYPSFYAIELNGDNAEYFSDADNELYDKHRDAVESEEVVVVETDGPIDFDETYDRPENQLRHGSTVIGDDWIQFKTYGKHTGEEFWTSQVNINIIETIYWNNKNKANGNTIQTQSSAK